MTLLTEGEQKALVEEIMTMKNTSTEAMPVHYVTCIFSANARGVKTNLSSVYTWARYM